MLYVFSVLIIFGGSIAGLGKRLITPPLSTMLPCDCIVRTLPGFYVLCSKLPSNGMSIFLLAHCDLDRWHGINYACISPWTALEYIGYRARSETRKRISSAAINKHVAEYRNKKGIELGEVVSFLGCMCFSWAHQSKTYLIRIQGVGKLFRSFASREVVKWG